MISFGGQKIRSNLNKRCTRCTFSLSFITSTFNLRISSMNSTSSVTHSSTFQRRRKKTFRVLLRRVLFEPLRRRFPLFGRVFLARIGDRLVKTETAAVFLVFGVELLEIFGNVSFEVEFLGHENESFSDGHRHEETFGILRVYEDHRVFQVELENFLLEEFDFEEAFDTLDHFHKFFFIQCQFGPENPKVDRFFFDSRGFYRGFVF